MGINKTVEEENAVHGIREKKKIKVSVFPKVPCLKNCKPNKFYFRSFL